MLNNFTCLFAIVSALAMYSLPAAAKQTISGSRQSISFSGIDEQSAVDDRFSINPGSRLAQETAASVAIGQTALILQDRYRATKSAAVRWELTFLALAAIDTAQTISCLNRDICEEANPIFGKAPKAGTLLAAKAGVGLLHVAAFRMLLKRDPKYALRIAQISAITQGGVVALNARIAF